MDQLEKKYESLKENNYQDVKLMVNMQISGFDDDEVLKALTEYDKIWIFEGEKMLRKDKLHEKMQNMYSSLTENKKQIQMVEIYESMVKNI
jgi:hypothetical protein